MRTNPMIQRLKPYEAGKPVEALERELGITGAIKLASNENAWGPAPGVFAAMTDAAREAHIYPDASYYRLREAIGAAVGFDPAHIVVGNGSNELLSLVTKTFASPGDTVLSSAGSFIAYKIIAMAHGHAFVETPLTAGDAFDLEALAARVDGTTRVIYLANPNNPTGTCHGHAAVAGFIEAVTTRAAVLGMEAPIIVLDEAYLEYVTLPDPVDAVSLVKAYPHVITARTFSKAYGLAALRVGYALCGEAVAGFLNRVREPFNVGGLAQAAAIAALADTDHLRTTVDACLAERARVFSALQGLGMRPTTSHTNFIFVRLSPEQARHLDPEGQGRAAPRLNDLLLRQGVIIRPMAAAGFIDAIRITIGLPHENARMLAALQASLGG
jgi:histidinol-phosphate aminotransferase